MKKDNLKPFINRLKKIGIEIELAGNAPWIYLSTICGKRVSEKYQANHGFTLGYYGKLDEKYAIKFTELSEIFKILRKYSGREKLKK